MRKTPSKWVTGVLSLLIEKASEKVALTRRPGNGKSAMPVSIEEIDDVPRYPPFSKGLPAVDAHLLVASQHDLIQRLRLALGVKKSIFDGVLMPVIYRYAEYVHLLPASESHHHRGAGGLFRHGLEVAFWATQAAHAVIFVQDGSPQERRNHQPCWVMAACIGGLFHDAGKPMSDVAVSDRDGIHQWVPSREPLLAWAKRHRIDHYFLRWRTNRHGRHEKFAIMALRKLLTDEMETYLYRPGPQVMEAMLEAIDGTTASASLSRLVLRADSTSVERDLKQMGMAHNEYDYGVAVERFVFDVIRRLVKSRAWKCNERGAQVWVTEHGTFINWRAATPKVIETLKKDNVHGVPQDPDTLADILIERDLAIPRLVADKNANGQPLQFRYWELAPELLQQPGSDGEVKLLVLRLDHSSRVFTSEVPVTVPARLIGEALPTDDDIGDDSVMRAEDIGLPMSNNEASDTASDSASPVSGSIEGTEDPGADDPGVIEALSRLGLGAGIGPTPKPSITAGETTSKDLNSGSPVSEGDSTKQAPSQQNPVSLDQLNAGVGMDMSMFTPSTMSASDKDKADASASAPANPCGGSQEAPKQPLNFQPGTDPGAGAGGDVDISKLLPPKSPSVSAGKGDSLPVAPADKNVSDDVSPATKKPLTVDSSLEALNAGICTDTSMFMPGKPSVVETDSAEKVSGKASTSTTPQPPAGLCELNAGDSERVDSSQQIASSGNTLSFDKTKPRLAPENPAKPVAAQSDRSASRVQDNTTRVTQAAKTPQGDEVPVFLVPMETRKERKRRNKQHREHVANKRGVPIARGKKAPNFVLPPEYVVKESAPEAEPQSPDPEGVGPENNLTLSPSPSATSQSVEFPSHESERQQGAPLTLSPKAVLTPEPEPVPKASATSASIVDSPVAESTATAKTEKTSATMSDTSSGFLPIKRKAKKKGGKADEDLRQTVIPSERKHSGAKSKKRSAAEGRKDQPDLFQVLQAPVSPVDETPPGTEEQKPKADPFENLAPMAPLSPTAPEAIEMLSQMILRGRGEWIGELPDEEDGAIKLPHTVLDLITGTYPKLTRGQLRMAISQSRNSTMSYQYAGGYIYVRQNVASIS